VKLREIATWGVRGVPDGEYRFTDARTGAPLDVVLVTGGPASGKTSLLEAIAATKEAVGAYGMPPDPKRIRRAGAREARIVATWVLSDVERSQARVERAEQTASWDLASGSARADADPGLRRLFAEFSRDPARSKLEYFPADRMLTEGVRPTFGRISAEAVARPRATRTHDKYACAIDGLRSLAWEEASRTAQAVRESGVALGRGATRTLGVFEKAVAAMLPDLRLSDFDLAESGGLRFERRTREVVGLDELSDSERQGVLFALAFPYLGLAGSVVLIDEPELHVHAAHRVRWLHALVGLGSDNQIIAATGAAEIVGAAAPGQVIDLSARR
jgi:hypothetical protein